MRILQKTGKKDIDQEFLKEICVKYNIDYWNNLLKNIIKDCGIDRNGSVGEEDLLTIFKRTNLF